MNYDIIFCFRFPSDSISYKVATRAGYIKKGNAKAFPKV
ncbi:hypothetical protein HSIEG1_2449 [Enterococcus sp. HSIEG1]|nr:hypothetical protein HSIEG1_2449 [Enterococcus sp. HSIEG1]OJG47275.1 hypothetical protein RV03_GL002454 [Enterococcus gallinarum]